MPRKVNNALTLAVLLAASSCFATGASAQVAGTTTMSVDVQAVATGWSVKRKFLGKAVYDDTGRKIGKIEDMIIAPDGKASYVIIGAGGFVGLGRHDVAIPTGGLAERNTKLILPGATRESIKAMPRFVYANT
jgi:hypothetical protein